ncbi:MAG: SDR family NAD(P)-dependent oxidoreductase, partial [Verrucomicrobia bacterium]|nr:SDR family NAD(P)-dependent oxidoreductase [Verrucomicrobiota bacterium]
MEKTLSGKNAIVTGGNKGIGRAICLRLAEAGANVAFAARDLPSLQTVSAELQQLGITPLACKLDLRSPSAARELVAIVVKKFGAIDILINNAGATVRGSFLNLREADWQDGFALKFFGA